MITHRCVLNAILYTNQSFRIGADDKVLAVTALHHDLSLYNIFGVLAAGGTLVIPEMSGRRDPAALVRAYGPGAGHLMEFCPSDDGNAAGIC